jgi:hypothetical protein
MASDGQKTKGEADPKAKSAGPSAAPPRAETQARQRVDTSALKSSYCNVCNATSTREEVVLNFGVNQDWDRGPDGLDIQLLHRIILSPFAAKRVTELMANLMKEYEARYGELK